MHLLLAHDIIEASIYGLDISNTLSIVS